jgi:3',5'-cyclic AMP phosphodiesterase CpdA
MGAKALVHLSDLHLGCSSATEEAARRFRDLLLRDDAGHVVVTGDITHRGRHADLARFKEIFRPLQDAGRLTVIPGNHDRNGEDCGADLMRGRLVTVVDRPGLHLVCVDTTGPHNRQIIQAEGILLSSTLLEIEKAVTRAPAESLVVVLLHHHLLPLPVEGFGEWFADQVGWSNAEELRLGRRLIARLRGRCDLILHGHRHVPAQIELFQDTARPLGVYNAGSSTELERARVFQHDGGRLLGPPRWMHAHGRARRISSPPAVTLPAW